MPQLNLLANTLLSQGQTIPFYEPFRATGGIVETFVTGGISYTLHTFLSGSGSFEITQGAANIEVLVVGGGGSGSIENVFPSRIDDNDINGGNGGGAGGYVFISQYVKKDPQYGIPSTFNAYVGEANKQSSFTQTFDLREYYYAPAIISSSFPGGYGSLDDAPSSEANGASGGGQGGLAIYGTQGNNGGGGSLSGGGGASTTGSGTTDLNTLSGIGGTGVTLPAYFGGPSGSYPIQICGGGYGGCFYRIAQTGTGGLYGKLISAQSGSYGSGAGGGSAAGLYNPPTLAQLTGSNGLPNTGGGGGGGGAIVDLNIPGYAGNFYGPPGNGGSGRIQVAYQTQF
jgi:hypothetical protein